MLQWAWRQSGVFILCPYSRGASGGFQCAKFGLNVTSRKNALVLPQFRCDVQRSCFGFET